MGIRDFALLNSRKAKSIEYVGWISNKKADNLLSLAS